MISIIEKQKVDKKFQRLIINVYTYMLGKEELLDSLAARHFNIQVNVSRDRYAKVCLAGLNNTR